MKKILLLLLLTPSLLFSQTKVFTPHHTADEFDWLRGKIYLGMPNASSAPTPASNEAGGLYYNTTSGKVFVWDGSAWVQLASGTLTVPISSLLSATATNTINNAGYTQTWTWNSLSGGNKGLVLSSTSTGTSGVLLDLLMPGSAGADNSTALNIYLSGSNSAANASTYGSVVSNDRTGTNSVNFGGTYSAANGTQNYGIQATATGGTYAVAGKFAATGGSNNYAILVPVNSGIVGIGTATPVALLTLGNNGFSAGSFSSAGSTSGTITFLPQAAAGTYNWNWPITAGTAGYALTSQGGGSSPMTWTAVGSGTVTSVSGTTNRITVATGTTTPVIDISAAYVGQTSLTTLGTIGTGAWNGTSIGAIYGGTGLNTGSSTGVAQVSGGTWSVSTALANGTTATSQTAHDSTTKVATDLYVDRAVASGVSGLGSGTLNYLPKWTPNGTTLGNSQIFDNGTSVGINNASPSASYKLDVGGTGLIAKFGTDPAVIAVGNTGSSVNAFVGGYYTSGGSNSTIYFGQNNYFSGSAWVHPDASAASGLYLMQSGAHYWYTLAAGGSGAGTNIMSLSTAGNLSIAGAATIPTSTATPLLIGGTGTTSTLTLSGTSNGSPSNAYLLLNPSNGQNVGVGTSAPTLAKLQVQNSTTTGSFPMAFFNGSNNGAFFVQTGSTSGFSGYGSGTNTTILAADYVSTGSYGDLALAAGGLTRLTIANSTGNVGIGTTSPAFPLHVLSSGATVAKFSTANSGFVFREATSASSYFSIFPQGVTPSSSNYTLAAENTGQYTILNGIQGSVIAVNAATIGSFTSAGLAVTGNEQVSGIMTVGTVSTGSSIGYYIQNAGVARWSMRDDAGTASHGFNIIDASNNNFLEIYPTTGFTQWSGSRFAFNGITSSFPALKRSGTSLQVRLADDSGDGNFQAGTITSTATVILKGYTVATLPAGTVGMTAYVTDALAPTFLSVVVGGGAITTPVFYNGSNWVGY